MSEYYLDFINIHLLAGAEWIFVAVDSKDRFTYYIDNAIDRERSYDGGYHKNKIAPLVGLRYDVFSNSPMSVYIKSTLSFINFAGGIKFNAGVRYYIL